MATKKTVLPWLIIFEIIFGVLGVVCLILMFISERHMTEYEKIFMYASIGFSFVAFVLAVIVRHMYEKNKEEHEQINKAAKGIYKIEKIEKADPPRIIKGWRDLTAKDYVQAGDQFLNPDWEVGGPWFTINDGNENIGLRYVPEKWRPMRRPIYQ